jgi:hypothetical protein
MGALRALHVAPDSRTLVYGAPLTLQKHGGRSDNFSTNQVRLNPVEFERSMSKDLKSSKSSQSVGISAASRITGVEVHTLRYWEQEFAEFLNPVRTDGGQRRYRPQDIQVVFQIKRLLRDEMFSIAGARRTLAKAGESAA